MSATTYTVRVGEDKDGLRLDRLLAEAVRDLSRTRLQALIAEGRLRAQPERPVTEASRRVRAGEVYTLEVPPPPPLETAAQAMPLDVVFEDEHLIVVDKPAGLVVHPGAGNPDRTLVNALLAHCSRLAACGGPRRPGIVHRLDKDTSGLIVAAKTDAAYASLVDQFATHSIERAYSALVWGVPVPASGRIEGNVGRDVRNRKRMAVVARGGKPAATRYRVVRDLVGGVLALLECRPETGRTHQIRVHLASRGHPIAGDTLYGGGVRRARRLPEPATTAVASLRRQALHAFLMALTHPATGDRLTFRAGLAHDIKELVDNL